MKEFDWTQAATQHRPEWISWLKDNHNEHIHLEEYMAAYRELRQNDPRPHNSRRYGTAHLRNTYITLKDKFGFFV